MAQSLAVIGAGLAGLACARRAAAAGYTVRLFERSRAAGGRLATRRFEAAAFDHGAQYFTVRDPGFAALVQSAAAAGAVAGWRPAWPGGEQEERRLWVGTPGMNALPRHLAAGLDLDCGRRIVALERAAHGWWLADDRGERHGPWDRVAIAVPPAGAAALGAPHTPLAAEVAAVPMAPCWAVLLAWATPLDVPADADWADDAVLPWYARNRSKPGRSGLDAWVLHAGADWSRARLDAGAAQVQAELTARFAERLGRVLPPPLLADAHRWRHARVEAPLGRPCLYDAGAGVGFCGDWCLDARVEPAYLSGDALGAALAADRGRGLR